MRKTWEFFSTYLCYPFVTGGNVMFEKPALIIINDLLLQQGLKQEEIDLLMSRFLEEEAYDYIETMQEIGELIDNKFKQSFS